MTFGCNLNAFLSWKLTDMKYERFLDSRSRLYCYLGYLLRDLFSQACCTIYIYILLYWMLKPWTTWSPLFQVDRMASHTKWYYFRKLHSKTSGDGWKFYAHVEMDQNLRNTRIIYSMLFHIWWDGEHPQLLANLMWKSMLSHDAGRLRPDVSDERWAGWRRGRPWTELDTTAVYTE